MIKLVITITALISLLATIIATPALAQDRAPAAVTPSGTVIFQADRITVKPCKVRTLEQGSGSVRICG